MKNTWPLAAFLSLAMGPLAHAQTTQPSDAKPASTNIVGQQYPMIDSQRRATFRVTAPNAQSVGVSLGNTKLTKGEDGLWTGTTTPLDPGFHYYQLMIEGVGVADPSSQSFFGVGNVRSGIEVPEAGVDFYDIKDVPHGEIRSRWYFSKSTNQMREAFVYTPPDYDTNSTARYPVLYLQHGMGEDRRAWPTQGRTNFILDNLIAAGKAKPMIIVMDDGGITPGMGGGGGRGRGGRGAGRGPDQARGPATNPAPAARGGTAGGMGSAFTSVIISDIIPMIDSTYRTLADRDHRAMAGLSLGGSQTYDITQANLDKFAWIGTFSAPFAPNPETAYNGLLTKPDEFSKQVKLLYISWGSKEVPGIGASNKAFHEALEKAGVKHVSFEAPGTAHEFQTWRKSLYGFAPLLFQN